MRAVRPSSALTRYRFVRFVLRMVWISWRLDKILVLFVWTGMNVITESVCWAVSTCFTPGALTRGCGEDGRRVRFARRYAVDAFLV